MSDEYVLQYVCLLQTKISKTGLVVSQNMKGLVIVESTVV